MKDLMNPCFSPHKKIFFPLTVRGKRIPLTSPGSGCGPSQRVCMWQRVSGTGLNEASHQSSLSLCHCSLLKDAPEMFSDPNFLLFPWCTGCPSALPGTWEAPLSSSWPCTDSYNELNRGWWALHSHEDPPDGWLLWRRVAEACFMALCRGL